MPILRGIVPGCGGRLGWRLRAVVVVGACGLALVLPSLAFGAGIGVVPDITWGDSQAQIDQTISVLKQAGVQWVRANVPWNALEQNGPTPDNPGYLASIDYAISQARAAGLNVLMPVADGVPYWASADPNKYVDASGVKHWNVRYKPSSYQDYANFFAWVVARYAPMGVHAYEVWNEPNLPAFWPSGPNPSDYVQMLKATYPAIKAADPSATVVLGGLSPTGAYSFLQGVYSAGGAQYFDALGYHDYPNGDPAKCWNGSDGLPASDSFCSLDEIRNIMVSDGDSAKQVWVTEIGWSTCSDTDPNCYDVGVTDTQQADYIGEALTMFNSSKYSYVKASFLYNGRDTSFGSDLGDWNNNLGIMHRDFSPKPAYNTVSTIAHGGTTTTGTSSGGTSTGGTTTPNQPPSVTLTSPTGGSSFDKTLAMSASASDDHGVAYVQFWVDNTKVATISAAPYGYTWSVPKKLSSGTHTVTAKAYDSAGLSASSSVTVTRAITAVMAKAISRVRDARAATTTLVVLRSGKRAQLNRTRFIGRIVHAGRGLAVLTLQRRFHHRWITRLVRLRVDSGGRFATTCWLLAGRWRARVTSKATTVRSSRTISFTIKPLLAR